jgi:DNA-binding beta-propeller fold protein YncE
MLTSAQSGAIATLAGQGEPGYAGDGGPAALASLNEPKSLALAQGCLFVADSENHAIRRIDLATGVITTVAGWPGEPAAVPPTAAASPTDLTDDDPLGGPSQTMPEKFAQLGDLSGTVRFVVGAPPKGGRFAGDGGPATQALLNFPSAIAVDQEGRLYIADTMNHRIRRVDPVTGTITTLAGTGAHRCSGDGGPALAATLHDPSALALDAQGNLYIADQSNNRVRRVDAATGLITTVAGTGQAAYTGDGMPGPESGLAGPSGLAFGPDGALYIADTFNGRIRRLDLATGLISTVAGDGGEYRYQGNPQEFSTSLSRPYGIAVEPDGNILITDSDSHLIRRWDRRRKIVTLVAGNGAARYAGDGGPARDSSLNYPFGVAMGPEGTIYIADTFNHRIRMIAP